jgi:hypothetical protein
MRKQNLTSETCLNLLKINKTRLNLDSMKSGKAKAKQMQTEERSRLRNVKA